MRHRHKRVPQREGVILAGTVLLAAALALCSLPLISLAGGNTAAVSTPTRERMAIEHAQVRVVEWQATSLRQRQIDALTSHMTQAQFPTSLVSLAPVMVDEGAATGIDCRLAPPIAAAESSAGRGSSDLYGAGWGGSWEDQTRRFFSQMRENGQRAGTTDVYQLTWIWRGSDQGEERQREYTENVVATVNSVGW